MASKLRENIEKFLYEDDSASATAAKFLLMTLALGGVAFAGAFAPNMFRHLSRYQKSKRYSRKQLNYAIYNLKKRKLIEVLQEKGDKIKVQLTNTGKKRIREFCFDTLVIKKPKRWDRKWRIVTFDIPVRRNRAREALREKIKELGFYQLQKSVWVYPYPCEDEILLIAEIYKVTHCVEVITAERILHESKLKRFFDID
jgi:CRISPR-associated endonuclease Cas2